MNRAEKIEAILYQEEIAAAATRKAAAMRKELLEEAMAEYEQDGIAPSWRSKIAVVPLALTTDVFKVANTTEFMTWVYENHPDQLEETVQVRPAFQKSLLKGLKGIDDIAFDSDGQIIPGIGFIPGGKPKGLSIRPKDGVREALASIAEAALDKIAPHAEAASE